MRTLAILVLVAAGLAWAGGNQSSVTVLSSWGVAPTTATAGLKLTGAEYVQCSVHGVDSTFSGGSVCWFYTPNETAGSTASAFAGDAGWEHLGNAKQTSVNAGSPDGGTVGRFLFPAKKIGLAYGRISCTGCPVVGTANDGGVAGFRVRTEIWGANYSAGP